MNTSLITKKIIPILKEQDVLKAAYFGSFARGEAKKNSDIDILIKLKGGKTLLDLIEIKQTLETILGKKVDLITYNGLNPLLKKAILKEQKIFYKR